MKTLLKIRIKIETCFIDHIKENPGVPLIVAFLVTLALSASSYSWDPKFADFVVERTFFILVAGVLLQMLVPKFRSIPKRCVKDVSRASTIEQ